VQCRRRRVRHVRRRSTVLAEVCSGRIPKLRTWLLSFTNLHITWCLFYLCLIKHQAVKTYGVWRHCSTFCFFGGYHQTRPPFPCNSASGTHSIWAPEPVWNPSQYRLSYRGSLTWMQRKASGVTYLAVVGGGGLSTSWDVWPRRPYGGSRCLFQPILSVDRIDCWNVTDCRRSGHWIWDWACVQPGPQHSVPLTPRPDKKDFALCESTGKAVPMHD
jgi:hypothetical protein